MTKVSLRHFARAGSGVVVSQLVALACLPFLFRAYGPASFGVWAVVQAVAVSVGGMAALRFELAIVVERERQAASEVFWLSVLLALGVSALFSLASIFALPFLEAETRALGWMAGAWVLLVGLGQGLQGWLLRDGAFGAVASGQMVNAVVTNGLHLLGAGLGADVNWLVAGSLGGQGALLAYSAWKVASSPPERFATCRGHLANAAWRHRRFAFFSAPNTLVSMARERLPVILLVTVLPAEQIGWYSQAWRLVHIPVGLSSSAVRPVMFHAAAEHGLAAQEPLVTRLLLVITVLAAPWLGVLACGPAAAFGLILGDAWRDAGPLAALLAVPALFFAQSNWMDRFLDLRGRQDLNLLAGVATTGLSVGALWLALGSGASLLVATGAQAAVLVVAYVGFMALAYRIARFSPAGLWRAFFLAWGLMAVFSIVVSSSAGAVGTWPAMGLGAALATLVTVLAVIRLRTVPLAGPGASAAGAT